jgi:hypothetical protein
MILTKSTREAILLLEEPRPYSHSADGMSVQTGVAIRRQRQLFGIVAA